MNLHPHFRHGLLASALLLASSGLAYAEPVKPVVKELQQAKTYTVSSAPIEPLQMDPPKLPDLSGYTAEAVQKKLDRSQKGKVSVRRMLQEESLKEFIGGDNKGAEWVRRQQGIPQAIFIDDGHVDLVQLSKQVPKQYLRETEPGVYLARLPIVVGRKGVLEINGKVKELRLSQEGHLLVSHPLKDGRGHRILAPEHRRSPQPAAAASTGTDATSPTALATLVEVERRSLEVYEQVLR